LICIRWIRVRLLVALMAGCAGCSAEPSGRSADETLAFARAENERAVLLIEEGKYRAAESVLQEVIAADPTFGPARNNLGLVYSRTGDLHPAAWQFEEASRLMPRRAEPHNNLGLLWDRADQYAKAADAFGRALQLDPGNVHYLGNLARVRVRRGDNDASLHEMLQDLMLRETRPDWRDWAKRTLLRLKSASPPELPTPAATRRAFSG